MWASILVTLADKLCLRIEVKIVKADADTLKRLITIIIADISLDHILRKTVQAQPLNEVDVKLFPGSGQLLVHSQMNFLDDKDLEQMKLKEGDGRKLFLLF